MLLKQWLILGFLVGGFALHVVSLFGLRAVFKVDAILFEKKPIWVYVLGGFLLLVSLFLFALLNSSFPNYSRISLASIFFISISLTSFVSIFVNKKVTMNS